MTIANTVWAWDQELPCAPKIVLVYLTDNLGNNDTFDANFEGIGKRCGLSVDDVKEALRHLEAVGLMSIWTFNVPGRSDPNWRCTIRYPFCDHDEIGATEQRRVAPPRPGWLYVIATDHNLAKIGITSNLVQRARDLENSNAVSIRLAWSYECDLAVARQTEQAVLASFAAHRAKGEWVRVPADDLIAEAKKLLGIPDGGGPP